MIYRLIRVGGASVLYVLVTHDKYGAKFLPICPRKWAGFHNVHATESCNEQVIFWSTEEDYSVSSVLAGQHTFRTFAAVNMRTPVVYRQLQTVQQQHVIEQVVPELRLPYFCPFQPAYHIYISFLIQHPRVHGLPRP